MKKDNDDFDQLFERFENQWDVEELNSSHQIDFLNKLNKKQPAKNIGAVWAIAASIVVLLGVSIFYNNQKPKEFKFASKETQRTDSIFSALIDNELVKLKEKKSPENEQIINDALQQMKAFDTDYEKIIKELQKNGENKQIIYAMISNLQTRISFLQTVLQRIEENENLKNNNDEKTF
ncbi:anti-sigma factor [Flavobacterium sp. Fl-77]|uniref:Anti-sigma factor n=1 Tax=Flavobacterium flavipigmentatum TaxID=2893884 RepID=A0AAJ2VYI2_9FLAO|nr:MULTISPECIES: anti-sigma factor [unclassified Flavobacterium]MDX6182816.1 anti-sigma factor [Flavobacterium sp. Fl-33]MDX6186269.1 anti-sigma factor [Flavobacterium sp. Fl-77]UFH37942.1 anti-sigma factor [Flavobacterium sp. F-70]